MKKDKKYRSWAEVHFSIMLDELKIDYEYDYRFSDSRRYMFDFAIVLPQVAIEIEGISANGTRHQRLVGYMNDCEKYNYALSLGWKVFRIPVPWLTSSRYYNKLADTLSQIKIAVNS